MPVRHTPGKSFKSSSATSVWFIVWLAAQNAPGFLVYCVHILDVFFFFLFFFLCSSSRSAFSSKKLIENIEHWGIDEAVMLKCADPGRSQKKIAEPRSAVDVQEENSFTFGCFMIFLMYHSACVSDVPVVVHHVPTCYPPLSQSHAPPLMRDSSVFILSWFSGGESAEETRGRRVRGVRLQRTLRRHVCLHGDRRP